MRRGVQYFPRGTVGEPVYPKDIWHRGEKYPRISCSGVPKRGDVTITGTPGHYGNHILVYMSPVLTGGIHVCLYTPTHRYTIAIYTTNIYTVYHVVGKVGEH
jgi:hypothetical protein